MPSITYDFPEQPDVSMHYLDHGSGEPPIVLVHGFGCAHGDWDAQIGALGHSHRVLACDLPGHGASTRSVQGSRVEHLGAHVGALLDSADLHRAYLVGHSMGCRVVMQAALAAPQRVAGLVFVDGSWIGHGDPERLEAEARALFTGRGFEATVTGLFDDMFLDGSDPDRARAVVERARSLDPSVGTDLFASLVAWDARHTADVVGRLECRMLAIQSTYLNDRRERVPLGENETTPWLDLLRERRPDAEIVVVPGVGHFTMFEAPEEVNRLLERFAL